MVRLLGVDRAVLPRQCMLGEPSDVEHRARHHSVPHARQQHAGVVALEHAESIGALADLIGEAVEIRLALLGTERCPCRQGLLRCADRCIDVLGLRTYARRR